MTGTSYNGTIPLAAATTGVDGLEAIIPVAPNTSYYHYYRSNGLVRHPFGFLGEDIDYLYDFIHSGNAPRREHCDCMVRDQEMKQRFRSDSWRLQRILGRSRLLERPAPREGRRTDGSCIQRLECDARTQQSNLPSPESPRRAHADLLPSRRPRRATADEDDESMVHALPARSAEMVWRKIREPGSSARRTRDPNRLRTTITPTPQQHRLRCILVRRCSAARSVDHRACRPIEASRHSSTISRSTAAHWLRRNGPTIA